MTPPSSPFARVKKAIVVWLDAEYRDQSARLQFDGPTPLVDEVASIFVAAFDTAAPGDDGVAALIVRLHEKRHALGLMGRRLA